MSNVCMSSKETGQCSIMGDSIIQFKMHDAYIKIRMSIDHRPI